MAEAAATSYALSPKWALKLLACPEGSNVARVSTVKDENLPRQDRERQEDESSLSKTEMVSSGPVVCIGEGRENG